MQSEPSGIPHPNLSDKVNNNIVCSEIEGGVYLNHVASDTRLEVETQNRRYTLWVRENGEVLIWGHPVYCPAPTRVRISGSNWGGSMLKAGFIGRGMYMEFRHPEHQTVITSRVREVREVSVAGHQSPVASFQRQ
jgi:hypothetical protein